MSTETHLHPLVILLNMLSSVRYEYSSNPLYGSLLVELHSLLMAPKPRLVAQTTFKQGLSQLLAAKHTHCLLADDYKGRCV